MACMLSFGHIVILCLCLSHAFTAPLTNRRGRQDKRSNSQRQAVTSSGVAATPSDPCEVERQTIQTLRGVVGAQGAVTFLLLLWIILQRERVRHFFRRICGGGAADDDRSILYMRYDAFVGYHDDSSQWMIDNFLPEVEALKHGYRVCMAERNFRPGTPIMECLAENIQKSRCTVILASSEFAKSLRCETILREAKACNQVMIILLLEGLDLEEINKPLKEQLELCTSLDVRQPGWAERLREALPATPLCDIDVASYAENTATTGAADGDADDAGEDTMDGGEPSDEGDDANLTDKSATEESGKRSATDARQAAATDITATNTGTGIPMTHLHSNISTNSPDAPHAIPATRASTDARKKPPVQDAHTKPAALDASQKPAVPDASLKPAVPDASQKPAVPDARKKPPVPDASQKPVLPAAREKPPVPDARTKPRAKNSRRKPSTKSMNNKTAFTDELDSAEASDEPGKPMGNTMPKGAAPHDSGPAPDHRPVMMQLKDLLGR